MENGITPFYQNNVYLFRNIYKAIIRSKKNLINRLTNAQKNCLQYQLCLYQKRAI